MCWFFKSPEGLFLFLSNSFLSFVFLRDSYVRGYDARKEKPVARARDIVGGF